MLRFRILPAILALALLAAPRKPPHAPEAAIESGRLSGISIDSLPRGGAFLGIPFVAQPIGELRWKAPQPAVSWRGTRAVTAFAPACPQAPSGWLPEMLGIHQMPTSEACLYLNIWTPDLHPNSPLPVFVWIHGGGNVEGSGEWPPLGPAVAEHGIVVVTLTYRLGALGFLSLADGATGTEHISGNYGHLDQLAALAWVHRNIARFGGDPARVTVGGQSSGALDICNLMASPRARGLFRAAILQSGVCVDSVYPSRTEADANGKRLATDLGIPFGPGTLGRLRTVPAQRLLSATAQDAALDFEPEIDGQVLPDQPARIFARGRQLAVPVLVGSNSNEVSIFASPLVSGNSWRPATVAQYRNWLTNKFHGDADRVFDEYPAHSDQQATRAFEAMDTDFDFTFGAMLLASETAQIGQRAYLYNFDYVGSGPFAALGSFHSEESMFLSRHYWTSWIAQPGDQPLSQAILGYWSQFIRTGNPNGPGLPHWAAYNQRNPRCQRLGREIAPEPVPHLDRFPVFQDYLNARLARRPQ